MWHSRPPRDPPPFMANAILNFHFDFLHPSLNTIEYAIKYYWTPLDTIEHHWTLLNAMEHH